MLTNHDISLLLISTIAAAATVFISFSFLVQLYRSANHKPRTLVVNLLSVAVGSALFTNHFLIVLSSNLGAPTSWSWALLCAWLFAIGIGTCWVKLTIPNKPRIHHLLLAGVIGGLCDLGLFYTSRVAIHGAGSFVFNPSMAAVGTIFSATMLTLALLQFQWIKAYAGKHLLQVQLASSTGIALGVLTIHSVFNAAFYDPAESSVIAEQVITQASTEITAIAIALGMVCFFLMLFIFVLFYEKRGKKLFNFSLSHTSPDKGSDGSNLQDSLTKLPNREAFDSHLTSAKQRCTRSGKSFALAYIDLDHFKPINDNFGHHVGDAVLSITAERLNTAIRGCDFVARIGGDEFVAILEEIDTEEDIKPIADRIVSSIKETYYIDHLNIDISCSVGVAIYPKDGDLEKLMVCADAAMYKAKDEGKNQYRFYDEEIESANDLMVNMQSDLCLAIENKEFSVAYLPKINCNTLTAIGAEALIRWNHPTKGEILPNDFLPAAEHFGLVQEINNWVIDECCGMLAHAKQAGLDLSVSINLSSLQFREPTLVKNIVKTIQYYDLNPGNISFEIKETVALNNQKQFKLLLEKFKEAGIKVVLDDFGLLPMSLTYLIDLNIDEVKLDKSFIAMLGRDEKAIPLIDAIFKLTHALGFQATAEGIETEAQQEAIIELGCDYMQGFLFSKPVKEADMFELYDKLQFKQLQIEFDQPKKQRKSA